MAATWCSKVLALLLVVFLALKITSCTFVYFKEPMPSVPPPIVELPSDLEGLYVVVDSGSQQDNSLISIDEIEKGHWSILSFEDADKDSSSFRNLDRSKELSVPVSSLTNHSEFMELLPGKGEEGIDPILFKFQERYYACKGGSLSEMNLSEGWYKNEKVSAKLVVKELGGCYFLNLAFTRGWITVCLMQKGDNFNVTSSVLEDKDYFEKYGAIPGIQKQNTVDSYLANVPDSLFLSFFEEPGIFAKTELVKIKAINFSTGLLVLKAIAILIGVVLIMNLLALHKRFSGRIEQHTERYGVHIGSFSMVNFQNTLGLTPLFIIIVATAIGLFVFCFPNNWRLVFGQSLLDLNPWAQPATFLSNLSNAAIFFIVIAIWAVPHLRKVHDKRIAELERHDRLYNSCLQKEEELFATAKNKFKFNPKDHSKDGFYDLTKLPEAIRFRHNHLLAFVRINECSEFNSLSELETAYHKVLTLHQELNLSLAEYQQEFGEFRHITISTKPI